MEQETRAKYRLELVEEDCIGCGACASVSDNWQMNYDKGKAFFIRKHIDELGSNQEAANGCPTQCIKVIKLEGKSGEENSA